MQHLSSRLRERYVQDLKLLPSDRFPVGFTQYEDVLKAHYLISDYFESTEGVEGLFGVKNIDMLCSAVARQDVAYEGVRKWDDEFEVAATLFYGLVKNHPFHDGNKRTALLALLNHLDRMKKVATVPQKEFEDLTLLVAESNWKKLRGFHAGKYASSADETDAVIILLARQLRRMTRQKDMTFRFVTYAELEHALSRFGFYFKDPYHNSIDVYQRRQKKFLGFKTNKYEDVKVANIGFPGMKRQVGKAALKNILHQLHLDEKNGFDKKCVFEGAEPMYKLIQDYEGPLRRLRDK